MIIHFISAEKFVERAISLFEEAFPGENLFYVFGNGTFFNKIKNKENVINIKLKSNWQNIKFLDYNKKDKIVFHNLYSKQNIFLANSSLLKENEKHFIFWGAELYNVSIFWPNSIFGHLTSKLPETKKFSIKKSIKKKLNDFLIKSLYPKKYNALNTSVLDKKKALEAMNVIHTHVKQDFLNLKSVLNINASWSNFSYYSNEDYDLNKHKIVGNKILVGNSASKSNNHLELFKILKDLGIQNDIICPLNYGDSSYANKISEIGENTFGEKFKSLRQFLPIEEYNKIQSECGIVIMNHYRQQACGNIIAALNMGCKVFLSNKSPLLEHFRDIGVTVYCIETDLKKLLDLKLPNSKLINANREALKLLYNRDVLIASLRESIIL